uniref:3-hydroxyacyl-CoA dehydrogenase type-2 n=1 Tax=Spongospora subterranea TaxID=70186 RepID=A0A0H5R6X8_9EUKA|eukprot:CRZ09868.1 hypothetical protein [Spongospora subterranea]
MLVNGRVFVVTGAASGLGYATCKAIIGQRGKVIGIDMDAVLGAKLIAEFGESSMFFAVANILDTQEITTALENGSYKFGDIHGLINCAGIILPRKVISSRGVTPLEDFQHVMNVNVVGSFNVVRLVSDRISRQSSTSSSKESGVIINVASIAAFDGQIGQSSYSASKAAIVGMTLPLARELSSFGIRVMTIAPGLFATPMTATDLSKTTMASVSSQVAFPKRPGHPDEFGKLCLSIIENSYLNGETIRLDGALRMSAL